MAASTVVTAARIGVKIKMVTRDRLAIAKETAQTLGMGTNILRGASLGDSKTKERAAGIKSLEDADRFSQVFFEHKSHIVDIVQKHEHIVGMTGDGVNNAPALKKADCGTAVSGATDAARAARAAASIALTTPGLSVIVDAIKESRHFLQRMSSYAIHRTAGTLRVLIFMTVAILIFIFYPLTAIMIVMLALLNDGAILSIAYEKVRYRNAPEAWSMRLVLGIATVLGLVGPFAAFGLFYLGGRIIKLGHPQLQTMMYLMVSVSGHLTIFQTRARGPWWSTRPARILLAAACGTQAVATLVAVYGAGLETPLGWSDAGVVWAYALGWFLLTDRVKQHAYNVLDTVKAYTAPSAEAEPDVDGTAEPHQASEPSGADTKPPAAPEPNPEAEARAPDADAKARTAAKPGDKPGDGPKDAPDAQSPPKSGSHPATEAAPRAAANPRGAAPSDPKPGDAVLSSAKPREAKLATPAAQMSTSQAAE